MDELQIRVVEFKTSPTSKNPIFYIETGNKFKEKIWWFFYKTRIGWTTLMDEELDPPKPYKFKNFEEALTMVEEIKKMQPIYHRIK